MIKASRRHVAEFWCRMMHSQTVAYFVKWPVVLCLSWWSVADERGYSTVPRSLFRMRTTVPFSSKVTSSMSACMRRIPRP